MSEPAQISAIHVLVVCPACRGSKTIEDPYAFYGELDRLKDEWEAANPRQPGETDYFARRADAFEEIERAELSRAGLQQLPPAAVECPECNGIGEQDRRLEPLQFIQGLGAAIARYEAVEP